MKRRPFLFALGAMLSPLRRVFADIVLPTHSVTLRDAHKGTLEIDTKLLDSYGQLPDNLRSFYFDVRNHLAANKAGTFTDEEILTAARKHRVLLMGGPMLGDLRDDGLTIWLRPATDSNITITVGDRLFQVQSPVPGRVTHVRINGLQPDTHYEYVARAGNEKAAEGRFTTAPSQNAKGKFRIAFGSCCHKIGVHNPNLFRTIVQRQPHAMMLLGDIAVDDRNNEINMHRADYQLRDVSEAWRHLVNNVPVFASWDDHDYFDNDLSGIPRKYSATDRDNVRKVWHENWINPPADTPRDGIYFSTRVGPAEIIMLDTRSCRDGQRRNEYGSYLGQPQLEWLKNTLQQSTAPFKVISSGTMWSDYVSNAKDSWGSWDKQAREEIFSLIEKDKIGGVLLVSGDRHGARAFRIPRPSGYSFYEFEPATLGGVSGPAGLVKNCPEQLFGHDGQSKGERLVAFGEFTFDTSTEDARVTFRLISQYGKTLEEIELTLDQLTPQSV